MPAARSIAGPATKTSTIVTPCTLTISAKPRRTQPTMPSFAGKCAQDQGEHPEQRSGLPDEKACQQTLETKGPQYRRASDRSEIGGEEQGRHRPVRLHTREQHQQEPAVAEHDEVRDEEH